MRREHDKTHDKIQISLSTSTITIGMGVGAQRFAHLRSDVQGQRVQLVQQDPQHGLYRL